MIVGTEWLIEAIGCDENSLREMKILREIFARVIADLNLKTINEGIWHQFAGEKGITALVALTESHLACHTYPEYKTATFNLYCCKTRPEWNWEANLRELLGAEIVNVQKIERRSTAVVPTAVSDASRFRVRNSAVTEEESAGRTLDGSRDDCGTDGRDDCGTRSSFPKLRFDEIKKRERGYLPHWEKENGVYFVTFRLEDSLPKKVLDEIKYERQHYEKVLTKLERELKPEEKRKMDSLFSEKFDEYLDVGIGECYLRNPEIADLVENALKHFDDKKYRLFAWCVMPNHVHVLLQVFPRHTLGEITHSWKSFTAHEADKILGITGKFWQRESYDHIVRSEKSFYKIVEYILNNPVKANLNNWRWVGARSISENKFEKFLM